MPSLIRRKPQKKGRARWEARFKDMGGREVSRTFRTKTEAEGYVAEARPSRIDGTYRRPTTTTVADGVDMYLEVAAIDLRPHSLANQRSSLRRHLVSNYGALLITELDSIILQGLYSKLVENGLSYSSARSNLLHVSAACRWWMEQGWIKSNPVRGVRMKGDKRREVKTLSTSEVKAMLDAMSGHRLQALIELLLTTGCRPSEATALSWNDIDLDAGTININKSMTWTKGSKHHVNGTKTPSGRRVVPVPVEAVATLREWKQRQSWERSRLGDSWPGHEFVFTDEAGQPLKQEQVRRHWVKVVEPVLGRRPTLYSLRHTMATLALESNVNVKVISERLGHSSVRITLDTYAHLTETMQDEATAVLGAAIYG